uniref:Putative secreted protein n=1 Tax=Anopheles darlingi TaxID=43151 RepID=A0A2M4DM69_ANODA
MARHAVLVVTLTFTFETEALRTVVRAPALRFSNHRRRRRRHGVHRQTTTSAATPPTTTTPLHLRLKHFELC